MKQRYISQIFTTFLFALMASNVTSFSVPPSIRSQKPFYSRITQLTASTKNGDGNILQTTFSGGVGVPQESYAKEALQIASRIKSVKDLGWNGPAKRAGSTRPRHRAWGGESEQPVQFKANYDESNPNCVEKWLTQPEFERLLKLKQSSSPASDAVYVALAKGAAYAERNFCEETIAKWYSGEKSIDPLAFWDTVEKGRSELLFGWGTFIGFNTLAASCIVFPTNPIAKGLEQIVDLALHQ